MSRMNVVAKEKQKSHINIDKALVASEHLSIIGGSIGSIAAAYVIGLIRRFAWYCQQAVNTSW